MGFGLPAAIGAAVGAPEKQVLLIDGDGSFNMTLNDLGTVMEHQLPVRIALMNDGRKLTLITVTCMLHQRPR